MESILIAFSFTVLAGLATGVGGLLAIFGGTSRQVLSAALGFSAGVMVYVSMIEILPKAVGSLLEERSESTSHWLAAAGFFAGIALIAIIDRFVPESVNPHEPTSTVDEEKRREHALLRMGTFTALALALHNFPEGFATFLAALDDPRVAIPIVVAIAIHNVPEGIAVAVPVYHATGSRMKALGYSTLSGLAEPAGALIGFAILQPFITPTLFGIVFAAVAGIMVFISFDELLPTAEKYGYHHHSVYGLVAGMAVMAVSLLIMM
ncbi:zinc transporter ZupT [Brevibacterium daeguense]|uniref:Zinc transporter ZupT n=1 Tax=Brevibacterium daeguense TaxID=909936 RepID=A0ABP8EJI1_9MICO